MYLAYDFWHSALAPWRLASEIAKDALSNPFNPMSGFLAPRIASASLEMFERATRVYAKPSFALGIRETVTPLSPFCRLIRFGEDSDKPKILVVAPLSGHYATLLRGTVAALIDRYSVTITDWSNAADVPLPAGRFGLDEYIDTCLTAMRMLGPDLNVMAVCQPCVPVLAAIARMEAEEDPLTPRTAILLGGPIDTRISPTAVDRLATERGIGWFKAHCLDTVPSGYAGAGRSVYPGYRQLAGFMAMNLDRHIEAHHGLFDDLVQGNADAAARHRRFYDEYLAVMDLPAEFYIETVARVFIDHALPQGYLSHRGRPVDLGEIRQCALFAIEGELDDITGLGQTRAVLDLTPNLPVSRKRYHMQSGAGHYGIFNGSSYRGVIVPLIGRFIAEHRSTETVDLAA